MVADEIMEQICDSAVPLLLLYYSPPLILSNGNFLQIRALIWILSFLCACVCACRAHANSGRIVFVIPAFSLRKSEIQCSSLVLHLYYYCTIGVQCSQIFSAIVLSTLMLVQSRQYIVIWFKAMPRVVNVYEGKAQHRIKNVIICSLCRKNLSTQWVHSLRLTLQPPLTLIFNETVFLQIQKNQVFHKSSCGTIKQFHSWIIALE